MSTDIREIQVTWNSANDHTLAPGELVFSDVITPGPGVLGWSIQPKVKNGGTPEPGDTVELEIHYTLGDPDGVLDDEYPTIGHARSLVTLDTFGNDPAIKPEFNIPFNCKQAKVSAKSNAASNSLVVSCIISELYDTATPTLIDERVPVTLAGPPRPLVEPSVGGSVTPESILDAGAGNSIHFLRVTYFTDNTETDVIAGNRLMNKHPDCEILSPGDSLPITSSHNITAVSVVGVGSVTNAGGNVISPDESTLAAVISEMLTLTFDAADVVRQINLELTPGWNSGQQAMFKVQGISHA